MSKKPNTNRSRIRSPNRLQEKRQKKTNTNNAIDRKMHKTNTINPFDVHVNKKKPTVLGQKLKHDRGLPGASRDKYLKMQKERLLVEDNRLKKSNVFIDKRIGQKNMTAEDRSMARYLKEMNSYYAEKEREMLRDLGTDVDPELQATHKGQKLSEIEKFQTYSSDDESDQDDKFMSLKLQNEAFFDNGDDSANAKRPYKEVIKDFVIQSKIRKLERKTLKDETAQLAEELDNCWKEMKPMMEKYKRTGDEINYKTAYDMEVSQFRNECFATATDKLTSQEELMRKERERAEISERERLKRMAAPFERQKVVQHRSADALDFEGNEEDEEDDDEEEDDEDEDEDEDDEEEDDEEEDDDEGDDEEDENEEDQNQAIDDTNNPEINANNDTKQPDIPDKDPESTEQIPIPTTFDQFRTLMADKTLPQQTSLISTMTSSNRSNKTKSSSLFEFIFNFCLHLADNSNEKNRYNQTMEFLEANYDCLFELLQADQMRSWDFMLSKLREAIDDYRKNGEHKFPKLSTFVYLKLVRYCLPTSDFRHQIVTPATLLIMQMLFVCRVVTRYDISYGVLLCATIKEYVTESKRFCPETIVFLDSLLGVAAGKTSKKSFEKCPKNALVIDRTETVIGAAKLNKFSDEKIDNAYRNWIVSVVVRIVGDFLDFWNELSAVVMIFDRFFANLDTLDADSYAPEVSKAIHDLKSKFAEIKHNKKYVRLHIKEKPKMLRLLEPKFDKILVRDKDFGKQQRNDDHEMFRKYKREKRGAIRKIRRDNEILTKAKIKSIRQADRERKEKVKKIFGEASMQQHELKKLEKLKKKL